ncbi:MAG: diacylglycerol/lipid kinase family protein [Lachnospiraceae bacterium]
MYTFIVNPNSRSGRGKAVWDLVEPILKERGVDYEVHFTKYQKHATAIVRELTADAEPHTLIVLGGDGTVNEVINGIRHYDKITLGYIPAGSSNDFSRAQKLPKDPIDGLNMILQSQHTRLVDIGILHYQEKKRRFIVSAGIGFDAAVCHQAVISKMKVLLNRLKLGKLTYAGIALNRLIYSTLTNLTLTLDDHPSVTFDSAFFATAMNHCYEGGGFKFCPKANPADGYLDIIVVNNASRLKVLALLPLAFFGLHTKFKCIHIFTCRSAIIETERALPVHCDGEPVFLQRKIQASLAEKQIRLITEN